MYGLYASDRNGIVEKGESFENRFFGVYIYITEFKVETRGYCKSLCKQKSVAYFSLQNFDYYMISVTDFYQSTISSKGAY